MGLGGSEVAIRSGDEIHVFADSAALAAWEELALQRELIPGPDLPELNEISGLSRASSDATANLSSGWTFGEKTVLIIRAEFPDDPGLPSAGAGDATDFEIEKVMKKVSTYFEDVSNGRCSFQSTILPGTVLLSRTKEYFNADPNSFGELGVEALELARAYDLANGATGSYNPDLFDRWIVIFKYTPGYEFGGKASLGGKGLWLNGGIDALGAVHELGHNHGLQHSHGWRPTGASPIGPGEREEYGDLFDIMGSGGFPGGHFNTMQKSSLLYLDAMEMTTVTTTGTYRLFRHDDRDAGNVRALKIAAGPENEYWIEYRAQVAFTGATVGDFNREKNGVLLYWNQSPGQMPPDPYLLDATPASKTELDFTDAPLALGESFTDADHAISITPLTTGGTSPGEWIDVRVEIGVPEINQAPTITVAPHPTQVAARSDVTFTASGTDADEDVVHYLWDFGDGVMNSSSTITHRWLKGGTFVVQCCAFDGRGGRASTSFEVTVEDPALSWERISLDPIGVGASVVTKVFFDGSRFVGLAGSTVVWSIDGIEWQRSSYITGNKLFTDVAYSGTHYVIVEYQYDSIDETNLVDPLVNVRALIFRTTDFETWEDRSPEGFSGRSESVAYGNGKFVAVGWGGRILYSSDGEEWTEAMSGASDFFGNILFADGRFVIGVKNGVTLTSTDGMNWATSFVDSDWGAIGYVTYLDGEWCYSDGSQGWKSHDGFTWTRQQAFAVNDWYFFFSLWSSARLGLFVAPGVGGNVYTSEDGQRWESTTILNESEMWLGPRSQNLYGFAEGNGVRVLTGPVGMVLVSGTPELSITAQPTNSNISTGGIATFSAGVTGQSTPTFQWQRKLAGSSTWSELSDGGAFSGTSTATLTITGTTLDMSGDQFRLIAANDGGSVTSEAATLTVEPEPEAPPSIATQPANTNISIGGTVTFSVTADIPSTTNWQWQRQAAGSSDWEDVTNGGVYSGATSPTLTISNVTTAMLGDRFRAVAQNSLGTAISSSASLAVYSEQSRLLNLSTRGLAQSGDNVLIPGFVISGSGTKRLLIRAVGPTLSSLGVTAPVVPNPTLVLKRLDSSITPAAYVDLAANDDWQGNANAAEIASVGASLGAFDFKDPKESALLVDLAPGQYTAIAGDKTGTSGIAIVELYDADTGTPSAKLVNISNRGFCGVGDEVMIPGLVISSEGPKTLLMRVVGPTLASSFGVGGAMANPTLTIFSGQTPILANDDWSDNADAANTAQIAHDIGAFALAANSKDAAFVVTLNPGPYTVVGSSADGKGTGVVLVEVYVVP